MTREKSKRFVFSSVLIGLNLEALKICVPDSGLAKAFLSLWFFFIISTLGADRPYDSAFWKSIRAHDFAVPPGESADKLVLEIVNLAADPDPAVRDDCGYEILADWIYKKNLVSAETLEAVRRKLIPGMTYHIGESDNPTVLRRSFSALYMSIVAARDLREPFLSESAFGETLATALTCYAKERDLRGYVAGNGWAHATAHMADLLKFLGRSQQLKTTDQARIIRAIQQRCRSAPSVFVWGEDARIAAALTSIVMRKDFDPSGFDPWFKALNAENKELWKTTPLDTAAYVHVRAQSNVLTQLAARLGALPNDAVPQAFRTALNTTLTEVN